MPRKPATLSGTMAVSPDYDVTNAGITDTLMLMGHDDNLTLNDPQPLSSVRELLSAMGPNVDSPLLQSMLEAYYAGNRDMWVMAVAPMSEYEADLNNRDTAYYQTYKNRLNTAFDQLKDLGIEDIVVPIEAPFNSTVDFLEPLLDYCVSRYNNEGEVCLGFMGTRGAVLQSDVDALANDTRLTNVDSAGKFISVFVGDGSFTLGELPYSYSRSVATTAAATLSTLPPDRGLTHRRLPNVVNLSFAELTDSQIETLALAGLNPISTTTRGRRGQPFEVVVETDNTLAPQDNDWWSLLQMRLSKKIVSEIYRLGIKRSPSPTIDQFRHDVSSYLANLQSNAMLRDYQFDAYRAPFDRNKIIVELVLTPFIGLRSINFDLLVAPGEQEF